MAPINVVMYMFSKVPTTPFLDPAKEFPQLEPLRQNWQMIRDEALALRDAQKIAASSTFNDAGFNSFFRRDVPEDHGVAGVAAGRARGDVRAAAVGQ
ncbi:hypothetical protein G6F24_016824 [Rhizopus arrhizus]|nr:hypothetical protein G6F24_016824 [Rhizopus arrhizus]